MQTTEIRRLQDDLKTPNDGRTLTPTNEFSEKTITMITISWKCN